MPIQKDYGKMQLSSALFASVERVVTLYFRATFGEYKKILNFIWFIRAF